LQDSNLDINAKDSYGWTPLHAACCLFSERDDEILTLILQQKGINVNIENEDKNTPLHYFCEKYRSPHCEDPFEIFIKRGANVNAQNKNGETPLHKAIFNNSVRVLMVNLLLKAGADVNKQNQMMGETPLHYAVRLGREDLVLDLLKYGADLTIRGHRVKKTAEEVAIDEEHLRMADLLRKAAELFAWLEKIQMERYKAVFIKEEMYLDVIPEINDQVLDNMNITTTGHRVKIKRAAAQLEKPAKQPEKPKDDKPEEKKKEDSSNKDAEKKPPVPSEDSSSKVVDIELALNQLKYINNSGSWRMHNSELEFTEKLGSGTSGTVYRGLYKDKEVAIKVLKTEQTQKELEEFKKEFQIMSTIQSPYIVFFFGACLEPKMCMVMEVCSKGSLYHLMNDPKFKMGWNQLIEFGMEMTKGLDCLHSWNPPVVHRDFKSLNLMVNDRFQVKVGDFGLSRFNTDTQKETLGKMRGTFAYCAPEVYFGEPFSTKSDVFSIGIVLWEMVQRCITGVYSRPYQEYPNLHFDFQIIIQTAKKGLRPTIPDSTPDAFVDLIKACWAHESASRPSCKEVVVKLEELDKNLAAHADDWAKAIQPTNEIKEDNTEN